MSLPSLPTARPDISYLIGIRVRTDLEIDHAWIALAFVNYVIWATFPILYFIVARVALPLVALFAVVVGLMGTATSLAVAYLAYSLVNVRNQHFAREQALLTESLGVVKSRVPQGNLRTLLPLDSAEQNFQFLVHEEKEKSAVLLGLFALIPYFGILVLIFILGIFSRDLQKHESREEMILDDLDRGLRESNLTPLIRRSGFVPRRSVPLLVVASILTLGVFSLIWLYLAIKDLRAHFGYHARLETNLLPSLSWGSTN
ncbi:MAG TPA: hypothetical protein VGS11_07200 [Candidatus Bathyarchaeia archaeon]|nr:hypothetical protein [Candidatus Bathyarchaeia archaeon]